MKAELRYERQGRYNTDMIYLASQLKYQSMSWLPYFTSRLPCFRCKNLESELLLLIVWCFPVAHQLELAELTTNMVESTAFAILPSISVHAAHARTCGRERQCVRMSSTCMDVCVSTCGSIRAYRREWVRPRTHKRTDIGGRMTKAESGFTSI